MKLRKPFHLDRRNGKLMGVCAGLANYTGVDATILRIALVVTTLLGAFPWTLVAYGVAAWIAKDKDRYAAADEIGALRTSTYELKHDMRDIDRRMVEIETYVTNPNSRLASEIEQLR